MVIGGSAGEAGSPSSGAAGVAGGSGGASSVGGSSGSGGSAGVGAAGAGAGPGGASGGAGASGTGGASGTSSTSGASGASGASSGAGGGAPWSAPVFTDVAVGAGLTYLQTTPDCAHTAAFAYMTGGAAVGDHDGDGKPDIAVSRLCGGIVLYRNQGDGTFADVSAASGVTLDVPVNGLSFADVDGDGDLDLYATGFLVDRHYLWINQGNGTFVEDAVARGASIPAGMPYPLHYGTGIAFGDYDHDGYLDLFVAEWRSFKFVTFGPNAYARLLHNRGAAQPGYFDDVTDAAGLDPLLTTGFPVTALTPVFIDLDDDGWVDLPMTNDFHTSMLFWNAGDGTFTDGTEAAAVNKDEYGMGAAFEDFDGDGKVDWFVTSIDGNYGSGNRLYRGLGNRKFEEVSKPAGVRHGGWGWGTAFFDYDDDGDVDLGMVAGVTSDNGDHTWEANAPHVWRNDGASVFTDVSQAVGVTSERLGRAFAVLDYDLDGDLDVFVTTYGGSPHLWRNDGGNQLDWLRVVARGKSNAQGVSAKVFVTPVLGGAQQRREIVVGGSYLSQHESVAHFGLGAAGGPVAEVRVRFPGASADVVLTDVPRRSTITVTEPGSP